MDAPHGEGVVSPRHLLEMLKETGYAWPGADIYLVVIKRISRGACSWEIELQF